MASQVEICNRALSRVGSTRLVEALTDQCVEAEQANLWWSSTLADLLGCFPWPFAKKRQALTISSATATDYSFVYVLPSDCLYPVRIIVAGVPEPRWDERPAFAVEGSLLLTNTEDAELVYVATQDDPTKFPEDFAYALQTLLAAKFAAALPKDMALAQRLEQEAQFKIRVAAARAGNTGQSGAPAVSQFEASRQ